MRRTFQELTVISGARRMGAGHVISYADETGKNRSAAM
jgi:hypothetical protein